MRARSYSNRALAVASGMLWAGIPHPTSAARPADQFSVFVAGFVPWGKLVSNKDHHKSKLVGLILSVLGQKQGVGVARVAC